MDSSHDRYPVIGLRTCFIKCTKEQRTRRAGLQYRQPGSCRDIEKMKKDRTIWLFTAIVFILPLTAFAFFNWYEKKWQKLPVLVGKEHHVGHFELTTQDKKVFTPSEWNNKIVVADFFFTHCPTICP